MNALRGTEIEYEICFDLSDKPGPRFPLRFQFVSNHAIFM